MSKNKNYFRHFYRAHEDDKLVQFRKIRGIKGIGEYWILVELCAEYTANNSKHYESISCKFHEKIIRDKLGLKQKNLRTFLEHCRNILGMIVEHSDNVIVFSIPKLPKYLGSYTEQVPILKESKVKESKVKKKREPEPTAPPKTNEVIKFYCDVYKKTYSVNPILTPADCGKIKNAFKGFSLDYSKKIIEGFFHTDDAWILKKKHDVGTLISNLQGLGLEIKSLEVSKDLFNKFDGGI